MNILIGHIYRQKSPDNDLPNAFTVVGVPDMQYVHTVQQGADPNNPKRWETASFVDNFELANTEHTTDATPTQSPEPEATSAATQPEVPAQPEGTPSAKGGKGSKASKKS